jgi:uncharacterized protein (TIGR03437 family)
MRTCVLTLLSFGAVLASAQTTPSVAPGGVENAASFQALPLAPGSLFTIFGSALASQTASASTVPFSNQLGGVTVQFTNTATNTTVNAPLSFVCGTCVAPNNSQVNAQVPWELVTPGTSATVSMVVSNNGVSSAPTQVSIAPFSPGIFGFNAASGSIYALAYTYQTGQFCWPTGSVPGLTTAPATPNTLIVIYATGLGAVNQTVPDGGVPTGSTPAQVNTPPVLMIGGVSVPIAFAGLTPQFPGVYQLNVELPAGVPTGNNVPVQLQINGITSPVTFTMAIN